MTMLTTPRFICEKLFRKNRTRRFLWAAAAVLSCVVLFGLMLLSSARKPSALEQDVALFLKAAAKMEGYNANLKSLVELGNPAVPSLVRAALWQPGLRDHFSEIAWRHHALRFLRPHLPDPEVIQIRSKSRQIAVVALGGMGQEARAALPALRRRARYDSDWERLVVLESMASIGPEAKDIPVFLQALKKEQGFWRVQGARGLGKLGPTAERTIPELVRTLSDSDEFVRRAAKEALAKIVVYPDRRPGNGKTAGH